MMSKKVKIVTLALLALLTVGWIQPTMVHACSSMAMCDNVAFSMGSSSMDDTCAFMRSPDTRQGTASHDSSSQQMPAGKLCTMKACAQSPVHLAAQHTEFFTLPTKTERLAFFSDACIPSSHLSGLFRPPRSNTTLWG